MNRIENITVIGAGIMGSGIAQSIFKYGYDVKLFDIDKTKVEEACKRIKNQARRRMDPEKIQPAFTFEEAVENTDLIIEAVFEDMDVKCALFEKLGQLAPPHIIFASNTSSLKVSVMAEASGRPEKFIGLHFFNPAIVMRLVEIVIPPLLNKGSLARVEEFIIGIKKIGIKCKESPGFVVNRILIPLVNESFYLLDEQTDGDEDLIITVANDIDSAIVNHKILLMGPFDLVDLTGVDTINHVAKKIYEGFDKSPRYKPSPLLKFLQDQGRFGRKSKQGIYYYENRTNDPDLNPCLDENGQKIKRRELPGFNSIEMVAVIVNEAFRIIEEGIVEDFRDIELSMELGTRWPKGPFLLAKETGVHVISTVLRDRYMKTGHPRYEMSGLFQNLPEDLENFFSDD